MASVAATGRRASLIEAAIHAAQHPCYRDHDRQQPFAPARPPTGALVA
jgi:hypothetical protein